MRKALWVLLVAGALGCSKHETGPVYTSVAGTWAYTTPDKGITVNFTLVKISADSVDIQNPSITVNGTKGNAAYLIRSSAPTIITYIHINANDIKLVYPYSIDFGVGAASLDFKSITFASAVYTYPTLSDTKTIPSAVLLRQ